MAAVWTEPVYDRTAADLAAGADKCYFSPELLNRIEGNLAWLADAFGVEIETRGWVSTDYLTRTQMQRILSNLQTVRDAYYTLPGTPDVPELPSTTYTDVNNIEYIVWSLRQWWDRNTSANAHCYTGTELYGGAEIGVI